MWRVSLVFVIVGMFVFSGCLLCASEAPGGNGSDIDDTLLESFEYETLEDFSNVWFTVNPSDGAEFSAELVSGEGIDGKAVRFSFSHSGEGTGNANVIWRKIVQIQECRGIQFDIKLEKGSADYIAVFFQDSSNPIRTYQNHYSYRLKIADLSNEWQTYTLRFGPEYLTGWSGATFEQLTWPFKNLSLNFLWPKGQELVVVIDNIRLVE